MSESHWHRGLPLKDRRLGRCPVDRPSPVCGNRSAQRLDPNGPTDRPTHEKICSGKTCRADAVDPQHCQREGSRASPKRGGRQQKSDDGASALGKHSATPNFCLLQPSPIARHPPPALRQPLIAVAGLIHSETQAGPNGFGLRKIRQGRNQDQGSSPLRLPLGSADGPQLAAPKSKYIEHILITTHTGEAGVAEVFRALQSRLRDATWTIVFKGLIVVHLMMREGQEDVTLKYLSLNPRSKLAISNFTEGACLPLPPVDADRRSPNPGSEH
jgi:hypothetical protein